MIVCVGTTPTVQRTMVFDRLQIDDVNRAAHVAEYASGKAVNVARVLRTLGHDALALGFAGGRRGQFLLEELARDRIPSDFAPAAAQTRLCTTVIDRATGHATELVEESPAATPDEWSALTARLEHHAARADVLVFAGTLAPGAPADFCDRWLAPGRVLVLDAKGDPLKRTLARAQADPDAGRLIAKLNRDELAATLGTPLGGEADLLAAVRQGAPSNGGVIVTLGKAGAVACIDGRLYRVRSPQVKAVSAVGSGDAFTAGLVAALRQSPESALQLAAACGAANALTPHSGHLTVEDVERLKPQARVEGIV